MNHQNSGFKVFLVFSQNERPNEIIQLQTLTKNKDKTNKRTVWPEPIWKKVNTSQLPLTQHQSTYPRGPESASIEISPFQTQIYLVNVPLNVNIVKQDSLDKKTVFENFMK